MSNDFDTFSVGVAQEKITPELPCCLAGYFHKRVAERVRDDLYVKALVVGELVLASCDLICLSEYVVNAVKTGIEKECGISREQILLCATHTHTAPELRKDVRAEWCSDEYVETLIETMIATIAKAAHSQFEATIHCGATDAPGYSFNRLFRNADGSEVFGRSGSGIIGSAGSVDSSLQTLVVRDLDKEVRAFVVNFACHPDVIGGGRADFVSADWPGEMGKNIASLYGESVPCLFLQGTAGDINHNSYTQGYLPRGGVPKAVQMGRALAGAAIYAGEKAPPLADATLSSSREILDIAYYTRDEKFMQKIAALKQKEERTYFENALIARTEEWDKDGKRVDFPVLCLRLGSVAIVGLPAEVFTGWGLEIKKYSPAEYTLVVELTDKRITNYIPTTDQATRGAYGAIPILSRMLEVDAGRLMVECAIKKLHELWQ